MLRLTPEQHRRLPINAMEEGVSLNRYLCARLNQGRVSSALLKRYHPKRFLASEIALATCCGETPPLAALLSRQDCSDNTG
ncbi:toxin-antitoxin system HicB family antitoxin [Serratia aquatilis]|uniref:toxin-antitoxin system HicB family antitoxin n=1 Tax=Serratia aquatilis TaxID=1737515 RepID=UPI00384A5CA2